MKIRNIFLAVIFFLVAGSSCVFGNSKKGKMMYFLDKGKSKTETETPYGDKKYIFIRLYDPNYASPLYIENILQGGIAVTQVNPETVSHASIGFDLSDNFFGLTAGGKYNLKIEKCMDVASNKYMGRCDPYKSLQSTYAIPVTEEEYEKAYNIILKNLNNRWLRYASAQNVPIASYSIKRKFFTKEEQQSLGSEALEDKLYDAKKFYREHINNPLRDKRFVCSSFVAWVLYNSVDSVKEWFDTNKVDVKFVTPSDLPHVQGVEFLFSSNWDNFERAAEDFSKSKPEFADYVPQVSFKAKED